jgi:hypothetical protein
MTNSIKSVFMCRMPSMNYVFANGKYAHFIESRYLTDIESEIAELNKEILIGNPFFYIDENQKTFDSSLQDKLNTAVAEAKLKVLKEEEERKIAAGEEINQLELVKLKEISALNIPSQTSGQAEVSLTGLIAVNTAAKV